MAKCRFDNQDTMPSLLKNSHRHSIPYSSSRSQRTWPSDNELERGQSRGSQTKSLREGGIIAIGKTGSSSVPPQLEIIHT